MLTMMKSSKYIFLLCLLLLQQVWIATAASALDRHRHHHYHEVQRPLYFSMNVYSRPNGKGTVQHIRQTLTEQQVDHDCFNLQSKHIGSIDLNDPSIKLTFYRSKDCLGASIHTMKPTCTHATKLMLKAKSVSIKRLKLVHVE